ncbi:MAG TPA: NAD(P)/FAD-dependent oxidoreductase [Planctomycetaceae bacterium]|nr:NAD(P)/FAD-dependent oxidoreductase [Planctomycetaceae bacterium]HQZ64957.1 NAD(P)/FAD-dependent oxidoreductase [Planctomycetaceae bacterium]
MAGSKTHRRLIIVGAGMSGLCLAIRLKKAGISDFTIVEKSDDVGGTWFENSYPNCGCDVPSFLYSFSFAPNYNWTRKYARQPEILQYFRDCADRFGIRPHVVFNRHVTQADWNEETHRWAVTLDDGQQLTADYLVSAVGQLNRPRIPQIPGADQFQGLSWHSARWNHAVDLTGKKVAIIGNGASTIQFVPEVAAKAERVYLFQRTPSWIQPRHNYRYPRWLQWCFRNLPMAAQLHRLWLFLMCELRIVAFRQGTVASWIYRWWLKRTMKTLIRPELTDALIPDYTPGCKRILLSSDYLQTLQQSNVTLVTEGLQSFGRDSVATVSREFPVDVVIYGTGFESTGFLQPMTIAGRGGVSLEGTWNGRPRTLFGLATPAFPNMFMLYGPNTNLGHNSIIYMVESQVDYLMKCLAEADRRKCCEIEVSEAAVTEYDKKLHTALEESVWAAECTNWYKTADGTISNNWAGSAMLYRIQTKRPDFNAWTFRFGDT